MWFGKQMSDSYTIKYRPKLNLEVHINMINVIRKHRKGILIDLPGIK
jgi:hypothetical protein